HRGAMLADRLRSLPPHEGGSPPAQWCRYSARGTRHVTAATAAGPFPTASCRFERRGPDAPDPRARRGAPAAAGPRRERVLPRAEPAPAGPRAVGARARADRPAPAGARRTALRVAPLRSRGAGRARQAGDGSALRRSLRHRLLERRAAGPAAVHGRPLPALVHAGRGRDACVDVVLVARATVLRRVVGPAWGALAAARRCRAGRSRDRARRGFAGVLARAAARRGVRARRGRLPPRGLE